MKMRPRSWQSGGGLRSPSRAAAAPAVATALLPPAGQTLGHLCGLGSTTRERAPGSPAGHRGAENMSVLDTCSPSKYPRASPCTPTPHWTPSPGRLRTRGRASGCGISAVGGDVRSHWTCSCSCTSPGSGCLPGYTTGSPGWVAVLGAGFTETKYIRISGGSLAFSTLHTPCWCLPEQHCPELPS